MFDRIENPARGRSGGSDGAAGAASLDDGTPFFAKGKQLIPSGRRLTLELPGGGGFGNPAERSDRDHQRDIDQGYLS